MQGYTLGYISSAYSGVFSWRSRVLRKCLEESDSGIGQSKGFSKCLEPLPKVASSSIQAEQ